jgi:hypothetical protein
MTASMVERAGGTPANADSAIRRVRARTIVLEIAVISGVFLLYRAGRMFTRDSSSRAFANAGFVVDVEQSLGIYTEQAVQRWALGSQFVIDTLNRYYVAVHFPATVAFLVWAFFRHHRAYRLVRTWFVAVTLVALVIHVGFPLAPPRMTPGFVDTLHEFGPRIYSTDPRRSVANQFAAMPSLHFGWALMLAVAFVTIKRTRRSMLIAVHPVLTLLAIVATGNHYWLDAIIAGVVAAVVGVVVLVLGRRQLPAPVDRPRRAVGLPQPVPHARAIDEPPCPSAARRVDRCRQHSPPRHEHQLEGTESAADASESSDDRSGAPAPER